MTKIKDFLSPLVAIYLATIWLNCQAHPDSHRAILNNSRINDYLHKHNYGIWERRNTGDQIAPEFFESDQNIPISAASHTAQVRRAVNEQRISADSVDEKSLQLHSGNRSETNLSQVTY